MKLAIFGIDGGTLSLVEKWKDDLPTLNRMMESGAYGTMVSTVPALTCPAWPSMFTGMNPGRLGFYDFIKLNGMPRVVNSKDYNSHSLWEILNKNGLKVGLLNVPLTYPAHEIDGYMVCGLGSPETSETMYTYPPRLKYELNRLVGNYVITPSVLLTVKNQENKCLHATVDALDKRIAVAKYLIENYPTDVFICVFFATDIVQHYFWRYMEKPNIYRYVIKDIYKTIDRAIGEMMGEFDNVMVVSDHGFSSCCGVFSINRWLEDNGYLKYQRSVRRGGLWRLRDKILEHASPELVRVGMNMLPDSFLNKLRTTGESRNEILSFWQNVDWGNTKAYALGTATGGIFVDDKSVKEEIVDELSKLGFHCIDKDEAFWGDFIDTAPDISIELGSSRYYPKAFGERVWMDTPISGSHHPEGIFMAYGKGVQKKRVSGKIYDVFSIALNLLGLSEPSVDGEVLL